MTSKPAPVSGCIGCGRRKTWRLAPPGIDLCADCYFAACPCAGCWTSTRLDGEIYMVHDHVWAAAGMKHGYLCIGCLENRLGRQLRREDFTSAPVNHDPGRRSSRLAGRLTRTAWAQLELPI